MSSRAFITAIAGLELTDAERAFMRAERPWGFILFKRNVDTPSASCWAGCRIADPCRGA